MRKYIFILLLSLPLNSCEEPGKFSKEVEKEFKIFFDSLTRYGNWCGPFNEKKYEDSTPIDELDTCCKAHDKRWGAAKADEDYLVCGEGYRADLDAELVNCVDPLRDIENWESPPKKPFSTLLYAETVYTVFSICDSQ